MQCSRMVWLSKWIYLLRVTDWEALSLSEIFKPLESVQFILAITGQPPPGGLEREMLALLVIHGGLALMNPIAYAQEQQNSSQLIIMCSTYSSNSTPEPQS